MTTGSRQLSCCVRAEKGCSLDDHDEQPGSRLREAFVLSPLRQTQHSRELDFVFNATLAALSNYFAIGNW